MAKNLRWKFLIIVGVVGAVGLRVLPARSEGSARPGPQGRRAPGDARADRRRGQARDRHDRRSSARADEDAEHPGATVTSVGPTEFRVDGIPPDQDAAFRQLADRRRADLQPLTRRRQLHLHDAAELVATSCAKKRSRRRCRLSSAASTSSASPSRSSRATAATIRSWCSCRASPTSPAPRRSSSRRRILELKLVEQGPFSDEAQARQAYGNNLPPDLQILPGHELGGAAGRSRRRRCYYVVRRVPAVTGRDLRNARPSLDENSRPAVELLAQQRRRAQVRRVHRREHQPPARDRPRQPRLLGAEHQQPHRRRRHHPGQLHAAGGGRPRRSCCARARCRRR